MPDKDELLWFPMRVTYGRQLKAKQYLESLGITTFLPMTAVATIDNQRLSHSAVPAISNLLFVRSTANTLNTLKQTNSTAATLRYMMRRPLNSPDTPAEIITVPQRQMDNFIRIASGPADGFTYLAPRELRGKNSGKVLITSGPFKGVEGTIKRIHGNRHVVVEIESLGGVCINFVPKNCMLKIE